MKKLLLVIFAFLFIMLGVSHAETGGNLSLTGETSTSVSTGNTGDKYQTAILSILPTEIAANIEKSFADLEIATGDSTFSQIDKRKEILQNIVNSIAVIVIASGENQGGTISKANMDFVIMPNICKITSSYNIDSTICNNGVYSESTEPENNGIMIVILIIMLGLIAIGGISIWRRITKKSTKIQSYITTIGIILIASFIFIGSYDSIDFKWIGLSIGGLICLFIGLVIFFSYKARKLAKENKLQEDKKQNISDLFHASTKAFEEGKNEEALNMCDETLKAIENLGISNYKEQDFYKSVERYQESLKKSYDSLKEALKIDRNDKESFIKAGEILFGLGKNEEAIKTYKDAIETFKDNKNLYCNLGTHLSNLGKHEEALEILDKAIKIDNGFKEAYYVSGIALYAIGEYEKALAMYDNAITIDKYYIDAYVNKGGTLEKLGKHEEALKTYDEAIKNNTYNSDIYNNKLAVLEKLGKHEEALKVCNDALNINPLDKRVYLNKGIIFLKLKRYKEALEVFDYIITKIDPLYIEAYNDKGITLKRLKRYEEALKTCDEAIGIDQNNVDIHINKSGILHELKQYENALKECDEVIKIDQNYSYAYYGKACTYSKMNENTKSIENLDIAIQKNSKWKEEAKKDEDFDNLRNLDEFKKIVGE